ncbi:hypothetical protein FRX31_012261, partial [Thalictrum thalictroides]
RVELPGQLKIKLKNLYGKVYKRHSFSYNFLKIYVHSFSRYTWEAVLQSTAFVTCFSRFIDLNLCLFSILLLNKLHPVLENVRA